jgi:hypothetical protein
MLTLNLYSTMSTNFSTQNPYNALWHNPNLTHKVHSLTIHLLLDGQHVSSYCKSFDCLEDVLRKWSKVTVSIWCGHQLH